MADAKEYNGWTNWSTWNLALWAENDQCTYGRVCQLAGEYTASLAEEMGDSLYPDGTPDMDAGDMADVDWQEIADAWNEE